MSTSTKAPEMTKNPRRIGKSGMKLAQKEENSDIRFNMIAEAAYYKAEQRNFSGSDATADWLEAERDITHQLNSGKQV